jgi:DoxX
MAQLDSRYSGNRSNGGAGNDQIKPGQRAGSAELKGLQCDIFDHREIAIKNVSVRSPHVVTKQGPLHERVDKPLRPSLSVSGDWYAIPLRLIVGYGFMEHGYAKLARGPDDFANILHALGMPAATLLSWATVLVELLGGLAVIAGAFIPLASR